MIGRNFRNLLVALERIGLSKLDKATWPNVEPRQIQLTNVIAGLGASVSFVQGSIELVQGALFYALSDLIGLLLMAATFGFNAMGMFRLSRVWILLVLSLDIYYFNAISQFTTGLELLYVVFLFPPFFLFSTHEKPLLLVVVSVPFVLYCLSRFSPGLLIIPERYVEAAPSWYAMGVPVIAFATTVLLTYRFQRINEEIQTQLVHHSKFASLGEFAAGISHEINNPLNVISMNAQLVRRELAKHPELPASIDSKLETIERATMRTADIVSGLRLFSREASADPYIVMDLNACIRETLMLCEQRFSFGNTRLVVELEAQPHIRGNPTQVSQVLINLLNNAYDAAQHVDERWIRLTTKISSRFVEIRISDSGHGIPKRLRSRVMEPFFTTKPVGQGTGLGLSISKGIVEAHRGKLILEPLEKHTTFLISFPIASVEELRA